MVKKENGGMIDMKIKIWKPFLNSLKEPSGILLLITNLIIIGFILYQNLEFKDIIWIFWFESLIILFFVCFKVFFISKESYDKVIKDEKNVKDKKIILIKNVFWGKVILVCIILFIFLFPLYFYNFFIKTLFGEKSFSLYIIPIMIFFLSHLASFIINFARDKNIQRIENFDKLVYEPTLRIVPMHIIIVIGGSIMVLTSFINLFGGSITKLFFNYLITVIFLIIKTIVDGATHYYVHNVSVK